MSKIVLNFQSKDNHTMIIIVPSNLKELNQLKQNLISLGFVNIEKTRRSKTLKVSVPKFNFESTIDLEDTIKSVSFKIL